MPNFRIQSFKFGLDTRRSLVTSQPGTLAKCENAHINEGAEIDKRKAFVRMGLPAGTFGLQATIKGFVVFGIGATPAGLAAYPSYNTTWGQNVPPLSYMVLTSPASFGATAMKALIFSTVYKGLPFCIAQFNDTNESVLAFYNGQFVQDFAAGEVGEVMVGPSYAADQATQAAAIINAGYAAGTINYTAVANGNVVTITGVSGNNFTVASTKNSAAGTIALAQQNVGIPGTAATQPSGSFTIQAGNAGTGTAPNIYSITVGVTFILGSIIGNGPVNWTGDAASMCAAVAAAINTKTGTSGFSALANGNTVTVYGPTGAVVSPLDLVIISIPSSNNDGAICLQSCNFNFGIPSGAVITFTNAVSSKAGILVAPATSIASSGYASINLFLLAIAKAINQYNVITSGYTPYYVATAVGSTLYISANVEDGNTPADEVTITFTEMGGGTVSGVSGLSATVQPQSVRGKIGGATAAVQVAVVGGYAPYTYAWTVNTAGIFVSNPTGSTASFSSPSLFQGVATCVVTDSNGQSVSVTVNILFN